jgi:hypothetical protein
MPMTLPCMKMLTTYAVTDSYPYIIQLSSRCHIYLFYITLFILLLCTIRKYYKEANWHTPESRCPPRMRENHKQLLTVKCRTFSDKVSFVFTHKVKLLSRTYKAGYCALKPKVTNATLLENVRSAKRCLRYEPLFNYGLIRPLLMKKEDVLT